MSQTIYQDLQAASQALRENGLYKLEHPIGGPQGGRVSVGGGGLINMCANNYLGLAGSPELISVAKIAMDNFGFGMASVRFICGTQTLHKKLEERLSRFLGMDDAILYSSCFDANGGLFETLLSEQDVVISDSLNHASIIDGVRLCKAQRLRYANNNMFELEECLKKSNEARYRLIVTDGVFSMDGVIANLSAICDLAERYDALVMVDDSHAVGVLGENGKGTHEYCGVMDRVDILTGTFGKALGGASGGYTAAKKPVVEWLRQRSRPYLFSNSLAPAIAAASIEALDLVEKNTQLRQRLESNSAYFRDALQAAGFTLTGADHPIIPVMIGDAKIASEFSKRLFENGVYAMAFSYPVVPHGQARIRTQVSAAHAQEELERCVEVFVEVGKALQVIG